jgi:hypothetical protein
MSQEENQAPVSPFEEIKQMNYTSAINILIQSANAAQKAGALSVRDAVLVASAAEFLTQESTTSDEKA